MFSLYCYVKSKKIPDSNAFIYGFDRKIYFKKNYYSALYRMFSLNSLHVSYLFLTHWDQRPQSMNSISCRCKNIFFMNIRYLMSIHIIRFTNDMTIFKPIKRLLVRKDFCCIKNSFALIILAVLLWSNKYRHKQTYIKATQASHSQY